MVFSGGRKEKTRGQRPFRRQSQQSRKLSRNALKVIGVLVDRTGSHIVYTRWKIQELVMQKFSKSLH